MKPFLTLDEFMPLIQPLIDAGCAFDIALPGGSFACRVVRHDVGWLHMFDAKGVRTAVQL